ncbi:Fic family protein [Streptococcus sp. SQ9-PEA]|uniref:Fic family protein n=1 Tax=Streptococcus sciuri TaxID=2973939 RepID=A0ABT2F6T3_9STRE|nr:Fic family protein [Streptococcus sciuri]
MRILTVDQIIELHSRLIQTTGGLDGVRDAGLIESSLSSAFSSYFGVEKYSSIEEKAARLCYSLVNIMPSLMVTSELEFMSCLFSLN